MNVPNNMRKFSLELAQQFHPLITRDGRKAKFIAYVPDVIDSHKLLVQICDEVVRHKPQGDNPHGNTQWDLFLAPLGYVEGKPVFAGDKLIGPCGDITAEPYMTEHGAFGLAKWPSKLPVVETRMSNQQLGFTYQNDDSHTVSGSCRSFANKAIERAIADGDVIPTSVVKKLMKEMTKYNWENPEGAEETIDTYVNEYLEGLK